VSDEDEVGIRWWHGNRLADVWAGKAAEANKVGRDEVEQLRAEKNKYQKVAGWAGLVTARCAEIMPHEKVGKVGGWGRARGPEMWKVPRHKLVRAGGKDEVQALRERSGDEVCCQEVEVVAMLGVGNSQGRSVREEEGARGCGHWAFAEGFVGAEGGGGGCVVRDLWALRAEGTERPREAVQRGRLEGWQGESGSVQKEQASKARYAAVRRASVLACGSLAGAGRTERGGRAAGSG
jgi:hypothetical protein